MRIKHYAITLALALSVLTAARAQNPTPIPTPKEFFGFNIGDNYMLANYTQAEAYVKKLAATSDRCKYTVIGKTEEGRDQFMLIISSPENLKNLDHYKSISQQLAHAENRSLEHVPRLYDQSRCPRRGNEQPPLAWPANPTPTAPMS